MEGTRREVKEGWGNERIGRRKRNEKGRRK